MIKRFLTLILVGICGLLLGVQFTYAQERNAEDLFQQARK